MLVTIFLEKTYYKQFGMFVELEHLSQNCGNHQVDQIKQIKQWYKEQTKAENVMMKISGYSARTEGGPHSDKNDLNVEILAPKAHCLVSIFLLREGKFLDGDSNLVKYLKSEEEEWTVSCKPWLRWFGCTGTSPPGWLWGSWRSSDSAKREGH